MRAVMEWNDDGTVIITLQPENQDEAHTLMLQMLGAGMTDEGRSGDTTEHAASTYQETNNEIVAIASGHEGRVESDKYGNDPILTIHLYKEP